MRIYADMSVVSLGRPPCPGILSTACGAAVTATTAPREPPAPSSMPEASDFPDTTGAAMLQYLTEQDYQEACEFRTGKGEMNSDLFNSTKS